MLKLARKYLLENKTRSALTIFCVMMSVGLMLGILLLNDTMLSSFKDRLEDIGGETTISLYKDSGFTSDEENWLLSELAIENHNKEYITSHKISTNNNNSVDVDIRGVDVNEEKRKRQLLPIKGEYFQSSNEYTREVIIGINSASKLGYNLKDTITLDTLSGSHTYEIIAFYDDNDFVTSDDSIEMFVSMESLQSDMLLASFYNELILTLDGDREYILSAIDLINEKIEDDIQITNNLQYYELAKKNIDSMIFGFNTISIVIFFVSSFLIYNMFTIVLIERIKIIGMLKALGMNRGKTIKLILYEGLIIGVVGSVLGVLTGILLGYLLLKFQLDVTNIGLKISQLNIIIAFSSGVIVAVISAYIPAKKMNKVSIIESLKVGENTLIEKEKDSFYSRSKTWIGLLFIFSNIIALNLPDSLLSDNAMMDRLYLTGQIP